MKGSKQILADHPAIREFQLITQIETLKLELTNEQRDHRHTAEMLKISERRIEGFERTIKSLSDYIDEVELRGISLWQRKVAYFEWREGWIGEADNENFDAYLEEDHARRSELGITAGDALRYAREKSEAKF